MAGSPNPDLLCRIAAPAVRFDPCALRAVAAVADAIADITNFCEPNVITSQTLNSVVNNVPELEASASAPLD